MIPASAITTPVNPKKQTNEKRHQILRFQPHRGWNLATLARHRPRGGSNPHRPRCCEIVFDGAENCISEETALCPAAGELPAAGGNGGSRRESAGGRSFQ